MTIPVLKAASLQRVLQSGRTKPCIFFCEDESGERSDEYVLKLRAGMENGVNGLAAVLIIGWATAAKSIVNIAHAKRTLHDILAEIE